MIYTVTLNPSIDYIVSVDDFRAGTLNRTASEVMNPGGKGINVSLVLKNLGIESTALGFTAGFTGCEIERLLGEKGIHTDFCRLGQGNSRINVKVRGEHETEINGRGPAVTDKDREALFDRLLQLREGDILILAGAVPAGMPSDIYAEICSRLGDRGAAVIVDAAGDLLRNTLQYHPFLIKPNIHELGDLFGTELKSTEEAVKYARRLRDMGAENVLVSMGADGAYLVTSDGKEYAAKAPAGEAVNTIGAGDSMVAGFLSGYIVSGDVPEALRTGTAAGSASAFSLGMCTLEQMEELKKNIVCQAVFQKN